MAEPRFRLRQPNSKKSQPITLILRSGKVKATIPTGYSVMPDHWNFRDQKVRNIVDANDKDEINSLLSTYYDTGELVLSQLKRQKKTITKESIKYEFNRILKENEEKLSESAEDNKAGLFNYIDMFIEKSKQRINPDTGEKLDSSTINKYKLAKERLQEFQKQYDRPVDFNFINMEFYYDYVDFLSEYKNYALNTVGKYIKTLKEILNDATENSANTNLTFKSRKFKTLTEDVDAIYLSEEELNVILELDLSNNSRLNKARDLFLIGAWTGLRFSDFSRLTKDDIIDNNLISIQSLKTKEKVVIPIHRSLEKIIQKYDWDFPESISNQNLNNYIKEVCEMAGINQTTTKTYTKGGRRIKEVYQKHELVSTHTARRSFATNLYKSGFPAISIMKITGHKTEKSFLKYIKVSLEEHAELLKKHWEKQSHFVKA